MCGRTYCSLSRDAIPLAAAYKTCEGRQYGRCDWFEGNPTPDNQTRHSYEPHFNQTSGHYLPIVVKKRAVDSTADAEERALISMRWGLTPHWIKSGDSSSKLNPINCRFETMTSKNTFSYPLKSGRRCVVLVDGFFEWKTNKDNSKDPYFLYFPQKYVDFKSRSADSIKRECESSEDNEWLGPRLLTIAAIYNKNCDNSFSFSIITVPNHSSLGWLHSRMPAILHSEDSVRDWLDFDRVSAEEAVKLLVPFGGLEYHLVSRLVSNTRNNSIENIWPQKAKTKQKTIDHWFKASKSDNSSTNETIAGIKEEDTKDCHTIEAKKVKL